MRDVSRVPRSTAGEYSHLTKDSFKVGCGRIIIGMELGRKRSQTNYRLAIKKTTRKTGKE